MNEETRSLSNENTVDVEEEDEQIPVLTPRFFYSGMDIDDPIGGVPVAGNREDRVWMLNDASLDKRDGDINSEGTVDDGKKRVKGRRKVLEMKPFYDEDNRELELTFCNINPNFVNRACHPRYLDDIDDCKEDLRVVVGILRLHWVNVANLIMEPIYWKSGSGDRVMVMRATWFYEETMSPVECGLANKLEEGYVKRRVWTETWKDELNSAIKIGPVGEEKIVYNLDDEDDDDEVHTTEPNGKTEGKIIESNDISVRRNRSNQPVNTPPEFTKLRPSSDIKDPNNERERMHWRVKLGRECAVLYLDGRRAVILRRNQRPSEYYNRRPLQRILSKGERIGLSVRRGFDSREWCKIYGRRLIYGDPDSSESSHETASTHSSLENHQHTSKKPLTSDLILVIHGIGQKLSESMEKFNFNHAINDLRREINVQFFTLNAPKSSTNSTPSDTLSSSTPAVESFTAACRSTTHHRFSSKPAKACEAADNTSRKVNGLTVLPVNWRLGLSLNDSPSDQTLQSDEELQRRAYLDSIKNEFSLQDITLETLPSIRRIISDVILDIPYYLSQEYKPKMLNALVCEANRIYRLWLKHNPNFIAMGGRVHILAHSLGSVMAFDILSNQPESISCVDTPMESKSTLDHFLFDTHFLFNCGSPVGLFLLLKQASLVPRSPSGTSVIPSPSAAAAAATSISPLSTQPKSPAPMPTTSLTSSPLTMSTSFFSTPTSSQIYGQRGQYGCLAVKSLYNILNPYDPVAYKLNPSIDSVYAKNLKTAWIPKCRQDSMFRRFNDLIWQNPFGSSLSSLFSFNKSNNVELSSSTTTLDSVSFEKMPCDETRSLSSSNPNSSQSHTTLNIPSPTNPLNSYPTSDFAIPSPSHPLRNSTVELELSTQNFTRSFIAETRAYLLNDNGQIDYLLPTRGGPLEFQYFSMLSAHTSYWTSRDFAAFIVREIFRKPGKEHTYANMRACKKSCTVVP